jgi:3-hydroxyisobutyrate dehydrogenase-like beta-hydroxyacid dehydrogenase
VKTPTICILHPGEMGAAVGQCARAAGARVVWASAGRGDATFRRAAAAGLEAFGTLADAVHAADYVLSVCPPHAAIDLAGAVAATGYRGVFVDANAIAPETARRVGMLVTAAGASFVDGGIIGPPPVEPGRSRLYLSGPRAAEVAALFAGTPLGAIAIEGGIGAASALKVCYAAWNKGSQLLLASVRALAAHEGVAATLADEWRLSQPDIERRLMQAVANARKGWRWVGEMEESAATFAAAGLPAGFSLAGAEICRRLAPFRDAPEATAEQVVGALLGDR